jgi:hypothetical protein
MAYVDEECTEISDLRFLPAVVARATATEAGAWTALLACLQLIGMWAFLVFLLFALDFVVI